MRLSPRQDAFGKMLLDADGGASDAAEWVERNSGRVQRFVRFCYFVPKLLLRFPFCVLFRHTGEPRQSVLTDSVYL